MITYDTFKKVKTGDYVHLYSIDELIEMSCVEEIENGIELTVPHTNHFYFIFEGTDLFDSLGKIHTVTDTTMDDELGGVAVVSVGKYYSDGCHPITAIKDVGKVFRGEYMSYLGEEYQRGLSAECGDLVVIQYGGFSAIYEVTENNKDTCLVTAKSKLHDSGVTVWNYLDIVEVFKQV